MYVKYEWRYISLYSMLKCISFSIQMNSAVLEKYLFFKEQLSSIVMSVELITVPMIIKVGSPQYLFQKWSEFWYSALLKLSFLSGNTIFLYFAFIPSITIYILLVLVIWDLCFFIIFVLLSDYSLWVFLFVFFKGDMMTPVEESVLLRENVCSLTVGQWLKVASSR